MDLKKKITNWMFVFVLLFTVSIVNAESNTSTSASGTITGSAEDKVKDQLGSIAGGVGMTWIDGQSYLALTMQPDFGIGKFGIGLDLNLRLNTDTWEPREEDWNDGAWRKMIRYIRWGKKNDKPVYAQVGVLPRAVIGHGMLMYNYNNSPSYENRTVGGALDIDFKYVGFESVYSNFNEAGVIGGRLFVRPLKFTDLGMIPVIGGLEIGVSFVNDFNKDSKIISSTYNTANELEIESASNTPMAFSVDVGLPLITFKLINSTLYYDFGKFIDYGQGQSFGLLTKVDLFGIVTASLKIERRIMGDEFIPAYWNAFYELDRYKPAYIDEDGNKYDGKGKIAQFKNAKAKSGNFGELVIDVMGMLQIIGGFQKSDEDPDGLLHLETKLPDDLIKVAELSASYDRKGIRKAEDLFKLDEDSLLTVFIAYKPYSFLSIGMNYYWTFEINDDGQLETQQRVEPKIQLSMRF